MPCHIGSGTGSFRIISEMCGYWEWHPRTTVSRKPNRLSKSKSRSAEAVWHASPEGRRQAKREFERALKDGTLARSSGSRIPRTNPEVLEKLLEQAKARATRPVSSL